MAQQNQSFASLIVSAVIVAIISFVGGYLVGNRNVKTAGDAPAAAEQAMGAARMPTAGDSGNIGNDSPILPIGNSPVKGPKNAPITIVEFSDYQCPFCEKVTNTLSALQEKYPNDIRIVFKNYPLPFHKQAPDAAAAALAAGEQGKYWEMHDKLFQNFRSFKGANMEELTSKYAQELGLDVAKYKADMKNMKSRIDEDMKLGQKVGVRGTPHSFINGERVSGAQPIDKFEAIVKAQLEEIKGLEQKGTARADIYKTMVQRKYKDAEKPKPKQRQTVVEYVPTGNSPAKGNTKDPLVTIIEFSDFQCPFCTRVNPTLKKVMDTYGDKVQVVFKQNPLPFHNEADEAAAAALAAHEQGKFWEMHDLLFENQKRLKEPTIFTELAKQLGLNMNKFEKTFNDPKTKAAVKADMDLGAKVGARGTPNFFINGVQLVGARPYPDFEAKIKEQIALATKISKEKGLKGEALYKAVAAENKKNAPKAAPTPNKPADNVDVKLLSIGESYTKGPKNAPVTIYEFSDFQCPFCSKGTNNLMEAFNKHKDKVQVVFKHYPLPFHKEADEASIAAMAAGKQGKFWEMHDLLFENQKRLKEPTIFTELAKQLGLNMAKFEQDMKNPALRAQIDKDMKMGQKVGVRGTPNFLVNGKRIVGAQPASAFEAAIEEALKK